MPIRIWTHLCDYANVDANGKASMIGEFDRMFVPSVPTGYPFFFVITKWNGVSNERFTHRVRIIAPNRQEIATGPESHVTIPATGNGEGNHITVDGFLMVEFPQYGEYAVEILLDGHPVHILTVTVVQAPLNLHAQPQ